MKKALSVILSAIIGASAVCTSAFAENNISTQSSDKLIAVYGDSISSGYGLSANEYNYGEICADYLGWEVRNYAHSGDTVNDLYNILTQNQEAAKTAAEADVIVVSIGANDIIHTALSFMVSYAAENSLLAEGVTVDMIPDVISLSDAPNYLDANKLKDYFSNHSSEAGTFINNLRKQLINTKNSKTGVVQNTVVPDTKKVIEYIQSVNNDADIIFQTIYQPLQFSQDFWEKEVLSRGNSYRSALLLFNDLLEQTMASYSDELSAISDEYGIKIADVYTDFTSVDYDDLSDTNQGYSHYFTRLEVIGEDGKYHVNPFSGEMDIHPSQKGHLAIAALVLEQIGELHDTYSTDLIRTVYNNETSDSEYPPYALETYQKVAGNLLAPPETTTTTSTTTTSTTTETSTSTSTTTTSTTTETSTSTSTTTTSTTTETSTSASTTTTSTTTETSTSTSTTTTSTTTETSTSTSTTTTSTTTETSTSASTTTANIVIIPETTTTAPQPAGDLGDVNADGAVNALDASLILTEYALIATGKDSSFSNEIKILADVNSDGSINALDASAVLTYYAYTATTNDANPKSLREFFQSQTASKSEETPDVTASNKENK